jgi:hypothetical protein
MTMVGSIGGGWLPKYFIARGRSVYDARMKAMLLIAFCPLVVLLAQPLGYWAYWVPVILIGVGASAHQAWSANLFTTVSDMFPKNARSARWSASAAWPAASAACWSPSWAAPVRLLRRAGPDPDRLPDHVRVLRHRLPAGLGRDEDAGPGAQDGRACRKDCRMPDTQAFAIERVGELRCTGGRKPGLERGENAWYWVDIPAKRSGAWMLPAARCAAGRRPRWRPASPSKRGGLIAGMETGIFSLALGDGDSVDAPAPGRAAAG